MVICSHGLRGGDSVKEMAQQPPRHPSISTGSLPSLNVKDSEVAKVK